MRGEELYNSSLADSCCVAATVESLGLGGGAPQRVLVGDKHTAECCNDGAGQATTKKNKNTKTKEAADEWGL